MKNLQNLESTKCILCNDTGWIFNKEKNSYSQCNCSKTKIAIEQLAATGLGPIAIKKSFKDFEPWNLQVKKMKDTATNYFLSFNRIKEQRNNSLALLGDSGVGKTHLMVALINNFVSKQNVKVVYMSYIDAITELKQNVLNGEVYQRIIRKYKNAEILAVDDLFKNGYTESDLRIMSEIINHRYINNLPMMFSSEYLLKDLIDIDKAIGGRIKEMSQNYLYEITGVENNYRMKKSDE
ncbi:DNA replication protein DnaC [Clostridium beijerinckii]|uniref:DNA replication protein DnaC n=1 Tax=Clostridium beijerinckii TaxID=1520 RepID=A0AAX0BCS7_CLOBE|nr:DNA replication protein DnaC [Clostridium beijerinckii]NYC75599.1 DNA replication protein DnaC [Clostridium beijerinckii]